MEPSVDACLFSAISALEQFSSLHRQALLRMPVLESFVLERMSGRDESWAEFILCIRTIVWERKRISRSLHCFTSIHWSERAPISGIITRLRWFYRSPCELVARNSSNVFSTWHLFASIAGTLMASHLSKEKLALMLYYYAQTVLYYLQVCWYATGYSSLYSEIERCQYI